MQNVSSLEVPLWSDSVVLGNHLSALRAENGLQFVWRPGEEPAFFHFSVWALAVRVGRGIEGTTGGCHLQCDVVEYFAGDPSVLFAPRHLGGFEVDRNQKCVVVEHLLEMGTSQRGSVE